MHFPHKFWNGQKKTDNANLVVSLYDKSWDPITYCISIKRMTFSLRTRCPDLCCLTCHWSHWIHLFSCDRANPGSGPGSDPIQDPVQDQIQFRIRPKRARKSYRWQKQHQPYLKFVKISTRRWLGSCLAHPPKRSADIKSLTSADVLRIVLTKIPSCCSLINFCQTKSETKVWYPGKITFYHIFKSYQTYLKKNWNIWYLVCQKIILKSSLPEWVCLSVINLTPTINTDCRLWWLPLWHVTEAAL